MLGAAFYYLISQYQWGTIKIVGNSIFLKDSDGDVRYVLSADQYKLTANPLTYTTPKWEYGLVRK